MRRPMSPIASAGVPAAVTLTPQENLLFTQTYSGSAGTQRTYSPDFAKGLYSKLMFRLSGTLSKTESAPGALGPEGPFPLIRSIRILGDGDVIKEIDPMHLRVLSHFILRGIDTSFTNVTLGTDASEAFSFRLELDFQSLLLTNPENAWWDASRYNQVALEVDWGGFTDLVFGGTYTGVSFGTTTLEVYGSMVLDAVARGAQYLVNKYQQKVFNVASIAQTQSGPYQLPVGEVIRGILLSQYTNNPRTPIATLVTAAAKINININGSLGKYTKTSTSWSELQQRNAARYRVAMPTGYAFIDFCENGNIRQALRADGGGVTSVEMMVDLASVAGAFLQATLLTYKPGLAPL